MRHPVNESILALVAPNFWKRSASPESNNKNNEKKTRKNLLYIEDTPKKTPNVWCRVGFSGKPF